MRHTIKIYVDILHECLNLLYNHFYSRVSFMNLLRLGSGSIIFFFFLVGSIILIFSDEFKLHKT